MPQPKSVLQPTYVLHGHMHAVPCGWQLGASWHVELMPAHAAISQLGNSAFFMLVTFCKVSGLGLELDIHFRKNNVVTIKLYHANDHNYNNERNFT